MEKVTSSNEFLHFFAVFFLNFFPFFHTKNIGDLLILSQCSHKSVSNKNARMLFCKYMKRLHVVNVAIVASKVTSCRYLFDRMTYDLLVVNKFFFFLPSHSRRTTLTICQVVCDACCALFGVVPSTTCLRTFHRCKNLSPM